MRGGIVRRCGGWQLFPDTYRLGLRQGHRAFHQLHFRISTRSFEQFKPKHSRGRGACRKFGISSWEATSFARKAVQVNWRAVVAREDVQVAMCIVRPRGFAAPSFIAILIDCQSLYKPMQTEMVMLSDAAASLVGLSVAKVARYLEVACLGS